MHTRNSRTLVYVGPALLGLLISLQSHAAAPAAAPAKAPASSCVDVGANFPQVSWTLKELAASCSDTPQVGRCDSATLQREILAGSTKSAIQAFCASTPAPAPASANAPAAKTLTAFPLEEAVELFPQVPIDAYQATAEGAEPTAISLLPDFPLQIIDANSPKRPSGVPAGKDTYVEAVAGCRWVTALISHPIRCRKRLTLTADPANKAAAALIKASATTGSNSGEATGEDVPPDPGLKSNGDELDGTHYLIKASDVDTPANTIGSYLTYGALYFPFKYRKYDHNFDTTPVNVAGTIGVAEKGNIFAIDWLAFVGASTIDVASNPAVAAAASTASKSATAVSYGVGAILTRVSDSHWNIGAFIGWDNLAGGQGGTWRYDHKVWYSIGLGYNWSTGKETSPTSGSTPAANVSP